MATYLKPEWWDEWVISKAPPEVKDDAPEWVKKEFEKFMNNTIGGGP